MTPIKNLRRAELLVDAVRQDLIELVDDDSELLSELGKSFKFPLKLSKALESKIAEAIAQRPHTSYAGYAQDLFSVVFSATARKEEVAAGHISTDVCLGGSEDNLLKVYTAMVPTSDEVFQATKQEMMIFYGLDEEVQALDREQVAVTYPL
ncbi:MAG: hypothetical protein AAFU78_17380 [Cyanobacteria bacterium J06633_2]